MNAHYINRAKQAIAEAERCIAKEEGRNATLRSADQQSLLDFYKSRHAEMVALLATETASV